jgi:hypothetical protein
MALLINSDNIYNTNGGVKLPSTNVLCRFIFQSELLTTNVKSFLVYWESLTSQIGQWQDINITYIDPLTSERTVLNNNFTFTLTQSELAALNILTVHELIKAELETILGPGTVTINLMI